MNEPCKHERLGDLDLCHNASQWRVAWQAALDGHRDAIGSFVDQTQTLVKAQHERDEALATITRVLVLIAPETQMAAGWLGLSRLFAESDIRAALEARP